MELYSSFWHILSAFFVFMATFFMAVYFGCYLKSSIVRSSFLFLWHSLFSLVYLYYVVANGGDSIAYYLSSFSDVLEFSVGTRFVIYFTSLLTQGLGFSILGCFFVFNLFGVLGLLAFDASLRSIVFGKKRSIRLLASIIVILPSVSFWSSGLGKDSISFMSIGFILWASLDFRKRYFIMAFSVLCIFLVRPHIAAVIISALGLTIIVNSKFSYFFRCFLVLIIVAIAYFLIPFALDYAGLGGGVDVSAVTDYIDKRQSYNMDGGGSVDISSMSYPMQLFTYMFRPLPFEAHSFASLMASLDNVFLLYLFIIGVSGFLMKKSSGIEVANNRLFISIYLFLSWSMLAMTTANVGISVRQKWMVAPFLIFLLFSYMGKARSLKDKF